jgi:haloacid dehalogenase superfamily, subfamily IA, variant 3 with third motif having DD or ED/haloacid dehalogenase superfamily, subfamily IA, variant 1 with third motif having Dx(3-4)D or Dx(3-4)E
MTSAVAPRPTTVVFDLGGVLIDWNPRHLYRTRFADEATMEAFLSTVCTQDWNERQDAGRSIAEAEAELIARFPEHADLIRAYYGEFDRMLAGPIAGTVAILEELHGRGTPLFALTNWSAETFHHARRRFDFLARFRAIVVSGEIGMIKPDPRIFRHLTDTYGLCPERCLFIDDNARNVDGARAAGLQAVRFHDPLQLRADLRAYGLL